VPHLFDIRFRVKIVRIKEDPAEPFSRPGPDSAFSRAGNTH
jgi:hypothetical protein